jgi:hypothetical protein
MIVTLNLLRPQSDLARFMEERSHALKIDVNPERQE